ncbi:hypothetical protein FQZ97_589870 [compost metagenome]
MNQPRLRRNPADATGLRCFRIGIAVDGGQRSLRGRQQPRLRQEGAGQQRQLIHRQPPEAVHPVIDVEGRTRHGAVFRVLAQGEAPTFVGGHPDRIVARAELHRLAIGGVADGQITRGVRRVDQAHLTIGPQQPDQQLLVGDAADDIGDPAQGRLLAGVLARGHTTRQLDAERLRRTRPAMDNRRVAERSHRRGGVCQVHHGAVAQVAMQHVIAGLDVDHPGQGLGRVIERRHRGAGPALHHQLAIGLQRHQVAVGADHMQQVGNRPGRRVAILGGRQQAPGPIAGHEQVVVEDDPPITQITVGPLNVQTVHPVALDLAAIRRDGPGGAGDRAGQQVARQRGAQAYRATGDGSAGLPGLQQILSTVVEDQVAVPQLLQVLDGDHRLGRQGEARQARPVPVADQVHDLPGDTGHLGAAKPLQCHQPASPLTWIRNWSSSTVP